MQAETFVVEMEAWNGLDAVMRVTMIARRAKLIPRDLNASFEPSRVRIVLKVTGDPRETRWLVAKLERLPEITSIRARRINGDYEETLVA